MCGFTLSQVQKFVFLLVECHKVSIGTILKIIKVPVDSSSVIHCASLPLASFINSQMVDFGLSTRSLIKILRWAKVWPFWYPTCSKKMLSYWLLLFESRDTSNFQCILSSFLTVHTSSEGKSECCDTKLKDFLKLKYITSTSLPLLIDTDILL